MADTGVCAILHNQRNRLLPFRQKRTITMESSSVPPLERQQKPSSSATSRKRKRGKEGESSKKKGGRWEVEQSDRYNRLVHACTKDLHKQAKVVKSFECQKIVRSLKKDGGGKNKKEEERLRKMKAFDLNIMVQEALRRLGIPNLQPQLVTTSTQPSATERQESDSNEVNKTTRSQTTTQSQQEKNVKEEDSNSEDHDATVADEVLLTGEETTKLTEKLLQHKRMQAAIDQWNDKVTDYRRWLLRKTESDPHSSSDGKRQQPKKKQSTGATTRSVGKDVIAGHGPLFVQLGGGGDLEDDGGADDADPYAHYGPGSALDEDGSKKNRPGQRARKAKALAMEARKQAKTWDSSINWRQKKPDNDETEHHQPTKKPRRRDSNVKSNDSHVQKQKYQSKPPTELGNEHVKSKDASTPDHLHPSWVAKQAQKKGIVEFKGTKITFS